ncbi:hypothetical protein MPSEU_000637600 [Mayamaea pseudoterrestris]|nr:hypothetical protein MPSEU_000637600 [Mayamaea pseudoterrestris]
MPTTNKDDSDDYDEEGLNNDDPQFSSAALCIEFELLGQSFRPVFTHQVFADEWIRGYQPFYQHLSETFERNAHSSFSNHDKVNMELAIAINLSPSCEYCSIDMTVRKIQPHVEARRYTKRPRLETTIKADACDTLVNAENSEVESIDAADEEYEEESVNDDDDDAAEANNISLHGKEGATRLARMPLAEVRQAMEFALPQHAQDSMARSCFLPSPVGEIIKTYRHNDIEFVLTLATGKDALTFHNQVQKLAIWYIETADDVNIADESEGYWKVLYLFRKHERMQFSFAGYMTLFHFRSPFHKPTPGVILRVAQALLLPCYQRMGHGRTMLHAVFDNVAANTTDAADDAMGLSKIVQVNVEDPAPEFTQLRNRVDLERYVQSRTDATDWFGEDGDKMPDDASFFTPLSELVLAKAAGEAKITKQQLQIVYELFRLQQLARHEGSADDLVVRDDFEKKFRLMVKARLNKVHADELSGYRNKEEKQKLLAKLFDERLRQYQAILASLKAGSAKTIGT